MLAVDDDVEPGGRQGIGDGEVARAVADERQRVGLVRVRHEHCPVDHVDPEADRPNRAEDGHDDRGRGRPVVLGVSDAAPAPASEART